MTDSRRTSRSPDTRWVVAAALLLLIPAAVLAAVSRGTGDDESERADTAFDATTLGMEHVHGLGVNPADGQLYAATHYGLFAVTDDGTATRVGNAQDTMGFVVAGPDTFLGSGHPDFTEDDEPLLGLIESTDAGRSWTPLSLRSEADFHALRIGHGRVWGYDSTSGTLMSTTDRAEWTELSRLPLRDFVVSPADADVLLATTQEGPVRSADGGKTWQRVPDAPPLVVLDWAREDVLYGADVDGAVHVSDDGGVSWQRRGEVGGAPETMTSTRDRPLEVRVAVADLGIVASEDGAQTFTQLYRQR